MNLPFRAVLNSSSSNRSESVRQRRSQRGKERAGAAAEKIVKPSRPVTVRGGGFGTRQNTPIYRQSATTRPRRQFYVAMDSGAELRLPAIRLVNPGWRILSGMLVIALCVGIYSMLNSDYFRITSLDIVGLERVTANDLDSQLRLENLSILNVEPAVIQQQIETNFPDLADVQISIQMPNFVTISARERQPVLAWHQGDKTYWVDAEGVIFPVRGETSALVTVNTSADLPLANLSRQELIQSASQDESVPVTASANDAAAAAATSSTPAVNERKADLRLLNATLMLAKKLPEGTQIVYDPSFGLGWNDPGGWQVYIGKDLNDFDVKFAKYQTILKNLEDQGIKLTLISVEHPNAPFYRAVEEPQPQE